ncbi:MAG TPA: class I SAM-dependent methyltransferase [Terriglobia bacterium]|nr:class I SAM-dependent methyltransferase [Terriglobia bacterium]
MTWSLEQITSEALLARFNELCNQRPDMRVLSTLLERPLSLAWIHSIGAVHDEVMRTLVPPFPPLELRERTAAPELEMFLWTGLKDIEIIGGLYEKHRSTATRGQTTVLDFGCGCGRMTRFLSAVDGYVVHGCDVNPALAGWCQKNLARVQTAQTSPLPPTPYPDGIFDLVYSISILTHIPEPNIRKWLTEMARIMAPGALLVVTTHSYPALRITLDSPAHQQMLQMTSAEVATTIDNLATQKVVFRRYAADELEITSAGAEYGISFIDPSYFEGVSAGSEFTLLEYVPGGLRGWQDIVVLRKRG